MCGIAGEVAFFGARAPTSQWCSGCGRRCDRRGPDDSGAWADGWVALGHRRLRIIDLSDAGRQPITDDALGLTVVFNGCIYNHEHLRHVLADHHRFTSTSRDGARRSR